MTFTNTYQNALYCMRMPSLSICLQNMLSKQISLLYTIVLSSCIARLYSVHVPEEKNVQQIEVGDFALINYKPDLEDDEDILEDNICMELKLLTSRRVLSQLVS